MRRELSIFIFVLGLFAFNWPFLRIFNHSLPVYLFVTWFAFILIHALGSVGKKSE